MTNLSHFPIVRAEHLNLDELIYLHGISNYTFLYFKDGSHCLFAKTLGRFEDCLCGKVYVRISKSHIVRRDFIKDKVTPREVVLLNGLRLRVARRRAV